MSSWGKIVSALWNINMTLLPTPHNNFHFQKLPIEKETLSFFWTAANEYLYHLMDT